MSRFRATFPARHAVLTVIHVISEEQAARNVAISQEAGVDGAFLINHGDVEDADLLEIYRRVREQVQGFWLGINCVSLAPEEVFLQIGAFADGVWVDDALIEENGEQLSAQRVLHAQAACGWGGLYFGGVAFKYQRPVRNLGKAACAATPYMDVVTTSGPGTGQAARPEKVRAMKEAIGNFPLALASGVTPENVTDYLAWADCFLVATGISYTCDDLDPARVRDLVCVVRAWRG